MFVMKMQEYVPALEHTHSPNLIHPSPFTLPSIVLQVWNFLGLARVSMGDIRSGCEAYEKAIELEPNMLEAWLNLGQACKEEARVDEAERALTKVSEAV